MPRKFAFGLIVIALAMLVPTAVLVTRAVHLPVLLPRIYLTLTAMTLSVRRDHG